MASDDEDLDLFGSEEDEIEHDLQRGDDGDTGGDSGQDAEVTPVQEAGPRIKIAASGQSLVVTSKTLVKLPASAEIWSVKLPPSVAFESKPFVASEFLEQMQASDSFADEEADPSSKQMARSCRGGKLSGERKRESNARFVTWSDGSTQLMIGKQVLDVVMTPVQEGGHFIYSAESDQMSRCQGIVKSKALLRPCGGLTNRATQWRLRQLKLKNSIKQFGVRRTFEKTDPELEAAEKAKEHRRQEMARLRQERALERSQGYTAPQDFSASFLESGYNDAMTDSDDDYHGTTRPSNTSRGYHDDDLDAQDRLQSAKKGIAVIRSGAPSKRLRPESLPESEEDEAFASAAEEEDEEDEPLVRTAKPKKKRARVFEDSESD